MLSFRSRVDHLSDPSLDSPRSTKSLAMSAARTAVRRFATSARLRNQPAQGSQGQVYTPKTESMPAPPAQTQAPAQTQPAQTYSAPQQVGTAGNVPVEKPVGGLR